MSYNFITKEPTLIEIISGIYQSSYLFPALKQTLGSHKFKDGKLDTVVAKWLEIQDVNRQ
jgi:hypothetical protein